MNRRGFISLLGGLAAAPLVPWRGLIEPLISLPPRETLVLWPNSPWWYNGFSNSLPSSSALTEESLGCLLTQLQDSFAYTSRRIALPPTQLIVSQRSPGGLSINDAP